VSEAVVSITYFFGGEKDIEVQGFWVQRFRVQGSGVLGSEVQGFKVPGFKFQWFRGSRVPSAGSCVMGLEVQEDYQPEGEKRPARSNRDLLN